MDYIKFNCKDLEMISSGIGDMVRETQIYSERVNGIIDSLDPQIKKYEGISNQLAGVKSSSADISERIYSASIALGQIAEIYYTAENKVMESIQELPASIPPRAKSSEVSQGGPANLSRRDGAQQTTAPPAVATSSISNNNLVVEDWLFELIYEDNR